MTLRCTALYEGTASPCGEATRQKDPTLDVLPRGDDRTKSVSRGAPETNGSLDEEESWRLPQQWGVRLPHIRATLWRALIVEHTN